MRPLRNDGEVGGGNLMKHSIDLEHVKELWDEWEIHFLILASLSLQVFLCLTADMRRRTGSRAVMNVLWLAYLMADTVAIFVLGHLAVFARGPSHELIFFWAPFVLLHLGGQDTITAFSKQDNELWTRHLLSLVSQVAVAGYVVSKSSWPDPRLTAAMALVFLAGFLKYAGRTYCLYTASPKNLRVSSLRTLSNTIFRLQVAQAQANSSSDLVGASREIARQGITQTFQMMFSADRRWDPARGSSMGMEADDIMSVDAPVNDVSVIVAADGLPAIVEELKNIPDLCMVYHFVAGHLLRSYKYLYTKTPHSCHVSQIFYRATFLLACKNPCVLKLLGILFQLIQTFFHLSTIAAAMALFAASEKKGHYSEADIAVSYVLLAGAMVLDLLPAFMSLVSFARRPFRPGTASAWALLCLQNFTVEPLGWQTRKQWSEELAQYGMVSRYTTSVHHQGCYASCMASILRWIGKCFSIAWCVEFFDLTRAPVTDDLKMLVLDKLFLQASVQQWDFACLRGERALRKWMETHHDQHVITSGYGALRQSISSSRVDFPTSVLIWHIATDICYFSEDHKGHGAIDETDDDEIKKKRKMMSREMSLYIMYLVFKCDVMLTSMSRLAHNNAHEGFRKFVSDRKSPQQGNLDEKEAVRAVVEALKKQEHQQGSMLEVAEAHQDTKNNDEEPASKEDDATTISRMQELLQSTEEALYSPVLPRALAVAQELMGIDGEADRWDLISEVWLEMLFYTAPRCGAAFHYEHLSTGGEFITHLLILMRNLGPFLPKPGA